MKDVDSDSEPDIELGPEQEEQRQEPVQADKGGNSTSR